MPRWIYTDGESSDEREKKRETLTRINAWWRGFEEQADAIDALFSRGGDFDLVGFMKRELQTIHPDLCWEFGPAIHGEGHRLVITPESNRHLRPLVSALLAAAPERAGWEYYAHRLPETCEDAKTTVSSRTGGDISDVLVHARPGRQNFVDLLFTKPTYESSEDQQANNDMFVACESLLGEETLDRWIGLIQVDNSDPAPARNTTSAPLEELLPTVRTLIDRIQRTLPDSPQHTIPEEDQQWMTINLNPTEAPD